MPEYPFDLQRGITWCEVTKLRRWHQENVPFEEGSDDSVFPEGAKP